MRKTVVFGVNANSIDPDQPGEIQSIYSDLEIRSTSVCSTVPKDCISGQRRPRSDCADAQSDLGLRCPPMLEDVFAWHGPSETPCFAPNAKGERN